MYLFAAGLLLVITITGVLSYGRAFWSAMNGSERNGNSTRPNKGPKGPIMVRFLEAALIVAFFMLVKLLMLYFFLYSKSEKLRWRLMLIMPTLNDRRK